MIGGVRRLLLAACALVVLTLPRPARADVPPDILVTRQLAAARGLAVGQIVRVSADPHGADAREFRVAGIYEPLPDPMRLAARRQEMRFHLPDLIALQPPSDEEPVHG